MQAHGRITSINNSEDPTTSQVTSNDADWLENITLDSSDYIVPLSKYRPELPHNPYPADEEATLTAHLWDRDHASDHDEYEWNSDDLVSETYSDDHNTSSDEEIPRLARKDLFEQGIRREWTWSREYREQWEEQHIFYKRKIQARLDAAGEYEGCSYGSEGSWSGVQAEQDWGTPATSGGVDWNAVSGDPWTAEDERAEWKREDWEPWTLSDNTRPMQDMDIADEEVSAGTDENSGEPRLWKQSPGLGPVSEQSAYNEPNSTSNIRHSFKSTHISSTTSTSLCHEPNITDPANTTTLFPHPPTLSQISATTLRNPTRTARFSDPEPVNPQAIRCSDPALDGGQVLDHILDTCIEKARALLLDGKKALNSKTKVNEVSEHTNNVSTRKKQPSQSKDATIKPSCETQASIHEKNITVPAEIVRVEGWWKVKGGEAWRELTGGVPDQIELCATTCGEGNVG